MADREAAAGALGLVQAFVNTADLETGADEFGDPNTLSAWLVARGLMVQGPQAIDADLIHAIAVREAIRGVIGANSGATVFPVDIATLNGAAAASRLRARFGSDGKARKPSSPIWPAPMLACRSRLDPRPVTESLQWMTSTRSRPTT